MAFVVTSQGARENNKITEFICDERSDISNLPKFPEVEIGSKAIVSDGSAWMLFPRNAWIEI